MASAQPEHERRLDRQPLEDQPILGNSTQETLVVA